MLLLRIFRRILCIIFIVKATVGQKNQQQRQQNELMPDTATQFVHTLLHDFPYYDQRFLMHKQYGSEKPTHQFVRHHQQEQQTKNGNSLAAKEIAMEILSGTFPAGAKSFNDVFKRLQHHEQQQSPNYWRLLNDISSIRTNFRGSQWYNAQRKQQQEMEKLNSENSNWHENEKGFELNADLAPVDNDDSTLVRESSGAAHMAHYDNVGDDAYTNPETKFIEHFMKTTTSPDAATIADNGYSVESIFDAPIVTQKNNEPFGKMENDIIMKRNPLAIDEYKYAFAQPRYPIALLTTNNDANKKSSINHMKLRSSKRERTPTERSSFLPSISAGAMTNLGTFFGDLSKNVHYNEEQDMHATKAKLLEGDHPLNMLRKEVEIEADEEAKIDKTAQFLQAIRSYRPSQRIRSLVSMTPQGYHGSNFLDPNYMWVGLG